MSNEQAAEPTPVYEAVSVVNFENEIYQKLIEAQAEARSNPKRLSHDEVFTPLRQKIANYSGSPKNA